MAREFPADFLWGTATAAHQVEGGNVGSDCWALEHAPDARLFREPSGDAIDHYHRYADDIALIAGLGFRAYRFSVEWARIEPEEGVFSLAALDHYKRMVEACRAAGLTPAVTLHHFSSPLWLAIKGGWNAPGIEALFARYCARVARHLGGAVALYCTINEPNVAELAPAPADPARRARAEARIRAALARHYNSENFSSFFFARGETAEAMKRAHVAAVAALREAAPHAQLGWTLALQDIQALPGGEAAMAAARARAQDSYLAVTAQDDFVGVQTYSRDLFDAAGRAAPPPGAPLTQMGYEDYPQALGATVRYAARVSGKPIYVTENGIATDDDARRAAFIAEALASLHGVIGEGVDVRGYFYWSAFDNFEWGQGYAKTFGLIGVDRATFARTVKPSARALGAIARANALA
jgi:beta-glucosidase